ncbi:AtpZ/AtpI family protein [Herbaspirillum sp. RV1423]|uniref:AtpZ/AtpI family protein n=1 Tax=Herbaspirillum sp. RV1423 TaxID=1443993 RepID=UPI0004BA93BE|nr:AtpZ/AtpI family protein [Herbaspirillum sp. RV1423]
MSDADPEQEVTSGVRRRLERRRSWLRDGDPTLARLFARVGVLGWMIVAPMLLGLLLGRWLDRSFGTGIFWSAPLLFVGGAIGCWSAWKWMQKP